MAADQVDYRVWWDDDAKVARTEWARLGLRH